MSTSTPSFAAVAALTGALSAAAQTPPPPAAAPSTRMDQTPIAVTGCLRVWDESMATAPVARDAAPSLTPRYVLLEVEPATAGSTPPFAPPAPTPSPAAASPAHPQLARFVVAAAPGLALAPHVNHRVRVTGLVQGDDSATSKKAETPPARPGDAPAPGSAAAPPDQAWGTMTVTAVAMVSPTCAPKS